MNPEGLRELQGNTRAKKADPLLAIFMPCGPKQQLSPGKKDCVYLWKRGDSLSGLKLTIFFFIQFQNTITCKICPYCKKNTFPRHVSVGDPTQSLGTFSLTESKVMDPPCRKAASTCLDLHWVDQWGKASLGIGNHMLGLWICTVAPKPHWGRLVGRDLGMVESPDDIEANANFLWKNPSRSKPTAIISASRLQYGSWMGEGWDMVVKVKQTGLE